MRTKSLLWIFIGLWGWGLPLLADQARILESDRDALQARIDLVQQAKKEILVEYYSFRDDDITVGAFALLLDAARERGVQVKILMDSLASFVSKPLLKALQERGRDKVTGKFNLQVKVYNPFNIMDWPSVNFRNHSKMIIVDGEKWIMGGRNISDRYFGLGERNYHDLDIIAAGNIVQQAKANFDETWNSKLSKSPELYQYSSEALAQDCWREEDWSSCEWAKEDSLRKIRSQVRRLESMLKKILNGRFSPPVKVGTQKDWLLGCPDYKIFGIFPKVPRSRPGPENGIGKKVFEYLRATQESLQILNPYFIPTKEFFRDLRRLRQKGVSVGVVTNSMRSTDNVFVQAAFGNVKPAFVRMGLEIYQYEGPDTLHGKAAVIDGKVGLVGTFNMDPRSAFINREIAVVIYDERRQEFVPKLEEQIDTFRRASFLAAKSGREYNTSRQFEGVSEANLILYRIFRRAFRLFPWLVSQL